VAEPWAVVAHREQLWWLLAEEAQLEPMNLDRAKTWLADDFVEHQVFSGTTPDKHGAIDSYRIFAASPTGEASGVAGQAVWDEGG
jgi:hypothetical protein